MKCPKCRRYLRDDAASHSCGWTSAVPMMTNCAHEGCPNPAIIAKKLPTGWAKLCKAHDLFHVQQEANEFCRANGLTTREAQIAFIREKLGAKLFRNIIREPGQEG